MGLHVEKIIQPFYEALEEGRILGRKCKACGHVEYPPYLACNKCGHLETEWVEISGKAICSLLLPVNAHGSDPEFEKAVGDYAVGVIEPENSDPVNAPVIGITKEMLSELRGQLPLPVRPKIVKTGEFSIVAWELDN